MHIYNVPSSKHNSLIIAHNPACMVLIQRATHSSKMQKKSNWSLSSVKKTENQKMVIIIFIIFELSIVFFLFIRFFNNWIFVQHDLTVKVLMTQLSLPAGL